MEIYRVRQRNVDSWVSNPVVREGFFLTKKGAEDFAEEIGCYRNGDGTFADIEFDTVTVLP